MTDAMFFAVWAIACLALYAAACVFVVALGRAAAKPAPWEDAYFSGGELPITRPDLDGEAQVVAEAEAIVKAAAS